MVKHDHPDALLLRFLRARKWDVHAALVMFVSTIHWRAKEMHVDDDIMINGEEHAVKESKAGSAAERKEGGDFMAQLRMGKSFLHGTDKDGRPCCYVRVKLHKQGEQSEKSLERFTVYTIETTRMMLKPPIDTEYANTIYEEWKLSTALNSTVVPSFWDSRNKWLWNNAAIFKILYDKQGSAHHEITTVEDLRARSGT